MKIQVNRDEHTLWDIEKMIEDLIKVDLGAKRVNVRCITKNWQGHTCPGFKGNADGLKLEIQGEVDPYFLEINPWNYEMYIHYYLAD